jgi:sulfoxide reductase heme-binding subunit YedZ
MADKARGMSAIVATAPRALWYLTRGTGTVAFLLLTVAVVLGIAHSVRWSPARTPRFVVQDLHRNISLLVIVFVVIHVATAIIDGFAPIRWLDAVVPFTSAYRAVWLGLGAVALDILLAVAVTSLLRARLGFRVWKGIHGSAYVCWVVAIFHGLGAGSDTRQTWMLALAACSVLAVLAATIWRVALGWSWWSPARVTLVTGAVTVPLVLAAFLFLGPLRPGWARSAGTPAHILSKSGGVVGSTPAAQPVSLVLPAQAHILGTAALNGTRGAGQVTLSGHATTTGTPRLGIRIEVAGREVEGALSVDSGTVAIVPPDGAAAYRGPVTGISETGGLQATLIDGHGDQIAVVLDASISQSGSFSGDLAIRAISTSGAPASGDQE